MAARSYYQPRELPQDVVLSIQRILQSDSGETEDVFMNFDTVKAINQLFPDGGHDLVSIKRSTRD